MWIRDTIKSVWQWIKNAGQYVVSEFLTNKDMSKWILDFDKFQEYNKLIETPWADDEDIKEIQGKMQSEWIIDPYLFGNYMVKSAEQKAKAEAKSSPIEKQVWQYVYDLRTNMSTDLWDSFKKWDKFQREVIAKAIDELTSQYQIQADNVLKMYEDTKSPELIKQWNELRPEYEQLIRDSAKNYAKYINEWLDVNEAYKKLIKEWKDKADRIIEIQNKLSNTMNRKAWVARNFKEAAAHLRWEWTSGSLLDELWNVPKWMFDIYKWLANVVNGVEWVISKWIEKGYNYFWKYDTLEELSHMNIYRDSAPILDQYRTLKNRWWEILDALPQLIPSVAWLLLWDKVSKITKLDQMTTTLLRWGKFIDWAADISKMWKFASESIQDLMWMDMVAQPLIGRPMTSQDFQENWIFNLPINAFLGSMVRWGKLIQWLPDWALSPKYISPDVLSLIEEWWKADDEIAKYWFAQNKTRSSNQLDEVIAGMPDMETWLVTGKTSKKNIDSMQDTIDIRQLPLEQQQRIYDSILPALVKHNDDIKKWKISVSDVALHDTLTKTVKTDAKNLSLGSKEPVTISKEAIKRVEELVWNLLTSSPVRLQKAKQEQVWLLNLYRSWDITKDNITSIINWTTPGLWQDMLKSIWFWDKEAQKRVIETMNNKLNQDMAVQSIEDAFNDTLRWVIELWEKTWWLKPGTQIWAYTFIGDWKRYWVASNKELTKEDLFERVSIPMWKRSLTTTKVARSDYFNYSIWKELEESIYKSAWWPVDISWVLRLDTKGITNYLNDYSWAKTWLQWILKQLNIKYNVDNVNVMVNTLTATNKSANELLNIHQSLRAKWFNITQLNKKEIAMYKLIHVKEYIEAAKTSWQKFPDFKAWFEKLYKEEDWIFKLDTNNIIINPEQSKKIAVDSANHDFAATEITSAQIITTSKLKKSFVPKETDELDVVLKSKTELDVLKAEVKWILWDAVETNTYKTMESAIFWALQHIDTAWADKEIFINAYWKTVWWLLWDRTSRKFLNKFFENTTEEFREQVILDLISRSLSKDEVVRSVMLQDIAKQIEWIKDAESHKWLTELIASMDALTYSGWENITDMLTKEMRAVLMNKLNWLISSRISFFYPAHDITKFDNIYKNISNWKIGRLMKSKQPLDIFRLTDEQIRTIADVKAYDSLNTYGIKNITAAKKISDWTYNLIQSYKERVSKFIDSEPEVIDGMIQPTTRAFLKFEWNEIAIMRDKDWIALNIQDYSDYQFLAMLWNVDSWFRYINIHEMVHMEQRIWSHWNILNNLEELLTVLKKQYSQIEEELKFWWVYDKDILKQRFGYFRNFQKNIDKTSQAQQDVMDMINPILEKIEKNEFNISEFSDTLKELYKTYNGMTAMKDGRPVDILYIVKEAVADWLYQAKTELALWLSKQEFDSISEVIEWAEEILNKLSVIFNDIAKKYSINEIEWTISANLSSLKDSITGDSILKTPTIYWDDISNTVNQWFLWQHFNKVSKNISDKAIDIRTKIYKYTTNIYKATNTPQTISLSWIEKVLRKSIGGYSIPTIDALSIILWKENKTFDINMISLTSKDIDEFHTKYKWDYTYIDEYIVDRIVAKILSSKALYTWRNIRWLNNLVYPKRLTLELSNIRNNEIIFSNTLLKALTSAWENTTWLTVFDLKKAVNSAWWDYKELMLDIHNYLFAKHFALESNEKTLSSMVYNIEKQLKPILDRTLTADIVDSTMWVNKKDILEWMYIEWGQTEIIDNIVDWMYNEIINANALFKHNEEFTSLKSWHIGKWQWFEYNSLLLFEWLHEKKWIKIADIKKLTENNDHFKTIFNNYSLKRNNTADMYTYLERKWIKTAREKHLIEKPIDIILNSWRNRKITIELSPFQNKASDIVEAFLQFIKNDEINKSILIKSDEIGNQVLIKWDSQYQLMKFRHSSVWWYVLDELKINKFTETVIPQDIIKTIDDRVLAKIKRAQDSRTVLKLPPLTEDEVKKLLSTLTGEEKYLEIPFSRPKSPLEILNEVKQYYNTPIKIDEAKSLSRLSHIERKNKFILWEIQRILKENPYTSKEYISNILDSKLVMWGKDVDESFKLVWVRVPYKLIWKQPSISKWLKMDEDIIMEGEYIAQWLSKSFISNESVLLKEKSDFIDNIYKSIVDEHPDMDKEVIQMIESWDTIAKVDYDNDIFQALLIKWWADEDKQTVYALIQRQKSWVYEILPNSIKDTAYKLDAEDAALRYERTVPRTQNISKIDAKTFDWLVKTADDDFKC